LIGEISSVWPTRVIWWGPDLAVGDDAEAGVNGLGHGVAELRYCEAAM
jgi:hypothetical protein